MIKTLKEVFIGKESSIKKISMFGEYYYFSLKDERVSYLSSMFSAPSALKALRSDLSIGFVQTSYLKKDCLEIIYLADDKESEKLVKRFLKIYKNKFLDRETDFLAMQKNNQYYPSVAYLKDLKLKFIIKISNEDSVEDLSYVFNKFFRNV